MGEKYPVYEPDLGPDASLPLSARDRITPPKPAQRHFHLRHLLLAFFVGVFTCISVQHSLYSWNHPRGRSASSTPHIVVANAVHSNDPSTPVGSIERHQYPPTAPINAYPTLFPTSVGHAGKKFTGAEPALIATAPSYPLHVGAAHLVLPNSFESSKNKKAKGTKEFNLFKHWGNLSPWYSVDRDAFGLNSGPETPETCRVTGVHLLHRHGARYPGSGEPYAGPAELSARLNAAADKFSASGELEFLNNWTYKLGDKLLTPFGRQQLYDLGVSMRLKYGFLLKNFTEANALPVFRTISKHRMVASSLNFAAGFFGYPFEHQYQQSIIVEARGFNNTLAPSNVCPNARDETKGERGTYFVRKWTEIYLQGALARLQPKLSGFNLTIEDVYSMQQLCPYETVSIGSSRFCELFTEEEWEGFNYASDLNFWYRAFFGSPVARALGTGWIQELVARLTHTPISEHNSSTNSTFNDNPITFPLDQSLYVDATHEAVILNIMTALNLTNFASSGPLPYDRIPRQRSFKTSEIIPFSTNLQFQLLECTSLPGPQIRIIINDGVTPLTGVKGCPAQIDGMCPVETFVAAQKEMIAKTDWNYDCHADWDVPEGPSWNTTTGLPPKRSDNIN